MVPIVKEEVFLPARENHTPPIIPTSPLKLYSIAGAILNKEEEEDTFIASSPVAVVPGVPENLDLPPSEYRKSVASTQFWLMEYSKDQPAAKLGPQVAFPSVPYPPPKQ